MADTAKLVRRSERVAFYGLPTESGETETYLRMEHFTSLSESKNPSTYERQYVDKDSSDSDVTGYDTALDYEFDHHKNDEVLKDLAAIQDDELKGETREIVTVDLFDKGDSKTDGEYVARRRTYSILPDSSGDGTDALQYSGTFAVKTSIEEGYAKVSSDGKTCTFSTKATA
jgi:hypothetical protein